MVSLDNLKTAISAIKSEMSSIASRYLKKTDANSIYITKKTANNSFATKSSVPKILSFIESPNTPYSVRYLKFPDRDYSNSVVGTIQYHEGQYDLGSLVFKGYENVQYAFSADIINSTLGDDRGSLSDAYADISELKSGESVSGVFAKTEDDLVRAKRAALSTTSKEFNTPSTMQGILYHDVRVDKYIFRLISTNINEVTPSSARLYCTLCDPSGHLYFFVSDTITSDTPINIPFTITRLDGVTPNPYGLTISVHGVDSVEEVEYTGASSKNIDIYSDLYEVKLTGPNGAGLYSSSLNFATIYEAYNNKRLLYIPYLDYRLRLVNIDPSGAYNFCYATFAEIIRKTEFGIDILVAEMSCSDEYSQLSGRVSKYTVPILSETSTGIILKSSTPGSEKFFSITVDDSGAIKATKV